MQASPRVSVLILDAIKRQFTFRVTRYFPELCAMVNIFLVRKRVQVSLRYPGKSSALTTAILLIITSVVFIPVGIAAESHLTLQQAERIAVDNDPLIKQIRAEQQAFEARSIAANTWPDPKLKIGVMNAPVDTYDLEQEPMTQTIIGLVQRFPPWGAVGAKREQLLDMADMKSHAQADRRLKVLRNVRFSWFDAYLYDASKKLVADSVKEFKQLIRITRQQYRAGRGKQQDVIRAQLEESLLLDKQTEIQEKYDIALARLQQSMAVESLLESLDLTSPELQAPPPLSRILAGLDNHPSILMYKSRIKSAQSGVKYEEAQSGTGWALNLQYGQRNGEPDRADLLSAIMVFDLPLFKSNRQDQRVSASRFEVQAANQKLTDWQLNLTQQYQVQQSSYDRVSERIELYKTTLLPQSEQNIEASLNAYKSGVSDFGEVVRARLTNLKSQLQLLMLETQRAKSHINLLYLAAI